MISVQVEVASASSTRKIQRSPAQDTENFRATFTGAFILEPCGGNASESDDEHEPEIDVHEENDIPHPKDYTDLVQWLKLSDEHLAPLHMNAAPAQRGSYDSTRVGKEISVRRAQELRKAEKERSEREKKENMQHGLKASSIHDFFSCARPVPREPEFLLRTNETPSPEIEESPQRLATWISTKMYKLKNRLITLSTLQ